MLGKISNKEAVWPPSGCPAALIIPNDLDKVCKNVAGGKCKYIRRMKGNIQIPRKTRIHEDHELSVHFSLASITGDIQKQKVTLPCVLSLQESLEIRYDSGEEPLV